MAERGPILVTGADRSGTTLLFGLFASHPAISMVRRTNLWRWFFEAYGDLGRPTNLEQCLAALADYPRLDVVSPDIERIRAEFANRDRTYGQLFDVVHGQHADRVGAARWGDKSLHTEHYAADIFRELPDARIVHLVRDPRDRYASIERRYSDGGRTPKGLGSTTGRWISSVQAGQANLAQFGPSRYRIVRYETLAGEPEATMRALCDFVDEPFDPVMLEMRAMADRTGDSGNSSFETLAPGEISTRSIGRFRDRLAPRTIATLQAIAGPYMTRHGYPPEPVVLSARERAQLWAIDVPVAATRVAIWMTRNRDGGEQGKALPAHRRESVSGAPGP